MNKNDRVQEEAIKTLASLSAAKTNINGTEWVDPKEAADERDRISKQVNPSHQETGQPSYQKGANTAETFMRQIKVAIVIAVFGYIIYGVASAVLFP
ncbi:MAG: hypothetical protein ACPGUE_19730 [Marinomonas sp.]